MNAFTIQQEIILLTSSTFSKRQSCEIKSLNKVNYLSLSQKLEKACWDGLLNNALPEITIRPTCFTTLPVKEVRNCKSCLLIVLSELRPRIEKFFSINSSYFLSAICRN